MQKLSSLILCDNYYTLLDVEINIATQFFLKKKCFPQYSVVFRNSIHIVFT